MVRQLREIRNFKKNKRIKRKRSGRTIYFIVILSSVFVLLVLFIVLKKRGGTVSSDLVPGIIYTGDKQQDKQKSAVDENEAVPAESGQEESANTDDFTFYKVLNSKEGDITPLNVDPPKVSPDRGKDKEKDADVIHDEKMSQIDSEIVKKIENKSKDDIIYTVQIGALRQEKAANELVSNLRSKGFAPYIMQENSSGRALLFKIRIGRFMSMIDAQDVAAVLKREGYATYVLKISGSE